MTNTNRPTKKTAEQSEISRLVAELAKAMEQTDKALEAMKAAL